MIIGALDGIESSRVERRSAAGQMRSLEEARAERERPRAGSSVLRTGQGYEAEAEKRDQRKKEGSNRTHLGRMSPRRD